MERGYSMPAHRSTACARLVVVANIATFSLLAIRSAGRSSAWSSSWTLSSLLRPLQDGSEDGSAAPLLAVHAVAYGASRFPENYVFVDGDPDVSMRFGWLLYAIRYGQEPWILVDTGFNDLPLANAFALTEHIDPLALLEARLGVRPAEVGTLIVTHHHFDHAGNVHRFPNAVVHMHAEVAEVLHLPENAWDCPGALDSPERRDCGPTWSECPPLAGPKLGSRASSGRTSRPVHGLARHPLRRGRGELGAHCTLGHCLGCSSQPRPRPPSPPPLTTQAGPTTPRAPSGSVATGAPHGCRATMSALSRHALLIEADADADA